MHVIDNALGQHQFVSRVQGSKLKRNNEIKVSAILKTLAEPLLRVVVVHELAHLREKEHNKGFYQLCQHMEANYHSRVERRGERHRRAHRGPYAGGLRPVSAQQWRAAAVVTLRHSTGSIRSGASRTGRARRQRSSDVRMNRLSRASQTMTTTAGVNRP